MSWFSASPKYVCTLDQRYWVGEAGAYRIELDGAQDREQIPFGLHQAGLEPPLPQGSAAPVPNVEGLHIRLAAEPHRRRYCASLIRLEQHLHVVVHQHKRMQPHSKPVAGTA